MGGTVSAASERRQRTFARGRRLVRFGLVGASGVVVNEGALAVVVHSTHLAVWLGPVIATQCSTAWNFVLVERWALRSSQGNHRMWHRFGLFWLMNNAVLLLRSPIIAALSAGLGMHILWSNLISLVILIVVRFAVADSIIWRPPPVREVTVTAAVEGT